MANSYPDDLVLGLSERVGQLSYAVAELVRVVDRLPVDSRPAHHQDPALYALRRDLVRLAGQFREHPDVVRAGEQIAAVEWRAGS